MGIRTQDGEQPVGPLDPLCYASWTVPSLWPQAAAASPPQPQSGGGGGRSGKAAGWEVSKCLLQVPQLSVESPFPPQAMGLPPLDCFTGRLLTQETQKALLSSCLLGSHSYPLTGSLRYQQDTYGEGAADR